MAYAQYTLADLIALFYEQVGGNTVFWRTDEVTRILQESFRVFNCLTGFWRARVSAGVTVANQNWYATPLGMTYLLRVELNNQPLVSTTLYDLDYGKDDWEADSGIPEAWAPAGVTQFAIWPADVNAGDSLTVEGVQPAPVLTGVGNVDLGKDELETILDYAEHIAQFKEGGQEFEASQQLLSEFLKEAGSRNAVLMQSAKFRSWMGLITGEKSRPMRLPGDERVGAR